MFKVDVSAWVQTSCNVGDLGAESFSADSHFVKQEKAMRCFFKIKAPDSNCLKRELGTRLFFKIKASRL